MSGRVIESQLQEFIEEEKYEDGQGPKPHSCIIRHATEHRVSPEAVHLLPEAQYALFKRCDNEICRLLVPLSAPPVEIRRAYYSYGPSVLKSPES
jgi:hypothetical protein